MGATTRRAVLGALAAIPLSSGGSRAGTPSFTGGTGTDPQADAWSGLCLVGEDAATLRVADLGKPAAFVNLWANWCPGCLSELDSISRMRDVIGPDRIEVVLVSHPSNWSADREFAQRRGLPFRLAGFAPGTPDETVAAAYNSVPGASYSVPQSLVFAGPRHDLAWVEEGAHDWDDPASLARLGTLLSQGK